MLPARAECVKFYIRIFLFYLPENICIKIKPKLWMVTEISGASREQSAGISQVAQAISKMDEVTQHNAALVEEASAAAESLERQAQGLTQIVERFKLLPGPAASPDAGVRNPPSAQRRRA